MAETSRDECLVNIALLASSDGRPGVAGRVESKRVLLISVAPYLKALIKAVVNVPALAYLLS